MSEDRVTIGLTPENKDVMDEIISSFNDQREAAKFAMALAIEKGTEPDRTENVETVWNVGSFDSNGELRDLVKALYPNVEKPYLAIEYFINQGFRTIDEHLEENKELDILELL